MARITGKFASLWLGAPLVKAIDLFDVNFEAVTEILTASIKDDKFDRVMPSHGSARITAQAYVTNFALLLNEVLQSADDQSPFQYLPFRMDLINADSNFSQITGFGYFSRVLLSAPRGMVVQDAEIIVDGEWDVTIA